MSAERHQLTAYLATLAALVTCFLGALALAALNDGVMGKIETFGLGTLVGGLIGVLRLPTQRNVTVDNAPGDPVPTAPQDAP